MKSTFGNSLTMSLFGESHGPGIGIVLDGLAPGIPLDLAHIRLRLAQRRGEASLSTTRREADEFELLSGFFEGHTTGAPLAILIRNGDAHSKDYGQLKAKPRPSHADYTAFCKYHGFQDYRGGGHFSGRVTAPVVAARRRLSADPRQPRRDAGHPHRPLRPAWPTRGCRRTAAC